MNFFKRAILSFLALLMFTTSSCFAVDIHRCGDEVKSRSFFSQAESCEKMSKRLLEANEELPECCKQYAKEKNKSSNSKSDYKKKPCCVNESFSYKHEANKSGDLVLVLAPSLDIDLPEFFAIVKEEFPAEIIVPSIISSPPDPYQIEDIQTLFQVFII